MVLRVKTVMIMLVIIIVSFTWISYVILDIIGIDVARIDIELENEEIEKMEEEQDTLNISTYDFSKLFIYGEDKYCNNNNNNDNSYRSAVVGGLYNTGTNALLTLLKENCFGLMTKKLPSNTLRYYKSIKKEIHAKVKYLNGFSFQSKYNITKHEAIPSIEQLMEKNISFNIENNSYSNDELWIIIIKDPLTWIKSMCKASYYVIFGHYSWKKKGQCPFGIHKLNGTQSELLWHGHLFKNIIELYNIYYQGWLDGNQTVGIGTKSRNNYLAKLGNFKQTTMKQFYSGLQQFVHKLASDDQFAQSIKKHKLFKMLQMLFKPILMPHIVLRFEDVLFRPKLIVDKVCKCVNGYRRSDTKLIDKAAKPHGKSKTRKQALNSYSNNNYRYSNYSNDDLIFVNNTINQTILSLFGYSI